MIDIPREVPKTGVCSVITVTVKDEEKRLSSKSLIYDSYCVHPDDPVIKDCIARALKDFNADPTDIRLKISLEVL